MSDHGNLPLAIHVPKLSPQLKKELEVYEEDMALIAEIKEKLKKLAAGIKNHGNVMLEVIEVFSMFQDEQGGQIRALSAVDDVSSSLRNLTSSAQGSWNTLTDGDANSPADMKAAKRMLKEMNKILDFIEIEGKNANSPLDKASLDSLKSALQSIIGNFGTSWGKSKGMFDKVKSWMKEMHNGANSPQVKNVQDGFQTENQTVSEFSTTTNTQLQFTENQFKQGMGEEKAAMDAYQKLNATEIRNSKSN